VGDIVQGILAAIDYNATQFEIINLGNHYSISLKDLIGTIEEVTGKKAALQQLPEQAGDVPHTYADIGKAQRLLNYQPTTKLKDGIQAFYEWYQQNKEVLLVS
jgi:UDP-glucuronate 4-epimerase